jgi:hypothetical protein
MADKSKSKKAKKSEKPARKRSDKCCKVVTHPLVKIEENKRRAVFKNPSRSEYEVTQVDGCLITDGIRSDYLIASEGTSVLVELKGACVAHACDQLFASVKHPSVVPFLKKQIGFLVIASRYPRYDDYVRKAKDRSFKEYKAGFHVVCDRGEFDIKRVAAIDGPR